MNTSETAEVGRSVTLALASPAGEILGSLPPFVVATPWWQHVEDVVAAARDRYAVDVTVLRLLHSERGEPPGGAVVYLGEVSHMPAAASLVPCHMQIEEHPLRMPWAKPGGPAAGLAWADEVLATHGLKRIASAQQVRTWNLSTLWRLPTARGNAWLKWVPPFFKHEGALLAELEGSTVPRLLGRHEGALLLEEIEGEDQYDADLEQLLRAVTLLVELQSRYAARVNTLLGIGLPDRRARALTASIASVVTRTSQELADPDRRSLDLFVEGLPARFAAIEAAGVPQTLVHGDFHPGNLRGTRERLTLLDWGDACVGHPLFDHAAFFDRVPAVALAAVRQHWHEAWTSAVPGCDPGQAATLLAPVAAARQAVIYREFLDNIEPAEHGYHRSDPARWLTRSAELLRASGAP